MESAAPVVEPVAKPPPTEKPQQKKKKKREEEAPPSEMSEEKQEEDKAEITMETPIDQYTRLLETRYPALYSTCMAQNSQKHLHRAIEELMRKDMLASRINDAERELKEANERVYDCLSEVDRCHNHLDTVRQQAREQRYSYLPF